MEAHAVSVLVRIFPNVPTSMLVRLFHTKARTHEEMKVEIDKMVTEEKERKTWEQKHT